MEVYLAKSASILNAGVYKVRLGTSQCYLFYNSWTNVTERGHDKVCLSCIESLHENVAGETINQIFYFNLLFKSNKIFIYTTGGPDSMGGVWI